MKVRGISEVNEPISPLNNRKSLKAPESILVSAIQGSGGHAGICQGSGSKPCCSDMVSNDMLSALNKLTYS